MGDPRNLGVLHTGDQARKRTQRRGIGNQDARDVVQFLHVPQAISQGHEKLVALLFGFSNHFCTGLTIRPDPYTGRLACNLPNFLGDGGDVFACALPEGLITFIGTRFRIKNTGHRHWLHAALGVGLHPVVHVLRMGPNFHQPGVGNRLDLRPGGHLLPGCGQTTKVNLLALRGVHPGTDRSQDRRPLKRPQHW